MNTNNKEKQASASHANKSTIKAILGTIVLIVVAMILYFEFRNYDQSTENVNTLKVGVILPLTGAMGEEGQKGLVAMKMAEKEVNENSKFPYKIHLLIEDGKFTGKDSLAAYNKLNMEGVDVFIVFGTPPVQAIKERVDAAQIPLLALDGSSGLAKSSEWIFECWPPLKEVGTAAGAFAKEKWSSKRKALLTMNTSGGDDFAEGFFSLIGDAIPRETFESDSVNVRPQVLKLLQGNPELICIFGYSSGYVSALNQILESGYQGGLLTDINITSIADKLKKGDREVYFVSQNFGNYINSPKSKKFIDEFKLKSNSEPTIFSAHMYEAVRILSESIDTEKISRIDIKRNLLALKNYPTMFGSISFSVDGDIHLPFIVLKMTGERIEEAKIDSKN